MLIFVLMAALGWAQSSPPKPAPAPAPPAISKAAIEARILSLKEAQQRVQGALMESEFWLSQIEQAEKAAADKKAVDEAVEKGKKAAKKPGREK